MNRYSIWVMEFAHVPQYHLSGLIYGAHNQGYRRLPYCYIVIKGQDRIAMVDAGYNHKAYGEVLATTYGVRNWHPPREVLAEIGITPEDVSTVFITHAHFDHMGNIEDFPNATFYIQERELSKWVWAMSLERRFRWLMLGIDPGDIMRAVDLARQGRLVCVNGDKQDALPGIDLHAAFDTHTWASMYVTVRNSDGPNSANTWVFAGDLAYTYENLRGMNPEDPQYIPVGLATGSQVNLIETSEAMVKAAGGDPHRVIPPHEDRLGSVFPSRTTAANLRITELALAAGEPSRVLSRAAGE
ncbi:MAG: N-acyl homoserine lactonase family protein [Bryobacterales bacterium]|nr:N-acyl homoserine lactonase family protein [Bryobacterales bacterium]MBV9397424.1 N-acyl homoserine lactonase family protein [Bryobacterales bacterium]